VTQEDHEAAAAAMVEATLTQENLGELHGRLSRCFARVEPLQQARKYIVGLMSDLPRKNCWTLAVRHEVA
jgi:hypothetical protein